MTMIVVTLNLPKEADAYYRNEAKRRGIPKGAVIREVLLENVANKKKEEQQAVAA